MGDPRMSSERRSTFELHRITRGQGGSVVVATYDTKESAESALVEAREGESTDSLYDFHVFRGTCRTARV